MSNNIIIYLFEISLKDGTKIFLNSSSDNMNINDIIYYKYSSLNIKEAEFNDSAQNYVNIEGIYEENGINGEVDLDESEFLIYIYDLNSCEKKLYLNYFYNSHLNIDDGYFLISLVPIAHRLNQNLVKLFSKTCRANFGDKSCQVKIENYKKTYQIKSIEANLISLENCDKESGYFDNGVLYFQDSKKRFIVEKQNNNILKLINDIELEFQTKKYLNLYPTCNKEFISCCKLFNNAVNFRGEPFAPTYVNLLK